MLTDVRTGRFGCREKSQKLKAYRDARQKYGTSCHPSLPSSQGAAPGQAQQLKDVVATQSAGVTTRNGCILELRRLRDEMHVDLLDFAKWLKQYDKDYKAAMTAACGDGFGGCPISLPCQSKWRAPLSNGAAGLKAKVRAIGDKLYHEWDEAAKDIQKHENEIKAADAYSADRAKAAVNLGKPKE